MSSLEMISFTACMHKDDLWHRLCMLLDPSTQVFGSFCVRLNLDGKMHKLEVVKKKHKSQYTA